MKRSRLFVVPIVAALILAGCGSDGGSSGDAADNSTVTVYTAPGLKDIVTQLVDKYKADNPDANVSISAGGTPNAVAAIKNKAVAVIVLPKPTLDRIQGSLPNAGFGRNLLVLAVPPDNPKKITTLTRFYADGVRRGTCVLFVAPDCQTKVFKQVADGDVDAALMFRGGLKAPKDVTVLDLPASPNLVIPVSYAVSGGTPAAIALGKFIASPPARQILTENGFLP